MKIGMFLQDKRLSVEEKNKFFYDTLENAKKNKLDLLVFPEHMYCPDDEKLNNLAFLYYDEEYDGEEIINIYKKYAKISNCPIVLSRCDKYGYIYGLFISPFNDEYKWYGKHIASSNSSFELLAYEDIIEQIFKPIEYKGYKIGITICYDSTQSIFSKAYGDIDILINLTGGHVDYKKWSIYQKTRALENKCSHLCTMAYSSNDAKNKSYVFGFDGFGKKIPYNIINSKTYSNSDLPNELYVFEVNKKAKDFQEFNVKKGEVDEFFNRPSTISKNITASFSVNEIYEFLKDENKITEGLYVVKIADSNLIIVDVPQYKIEDPIAVSKLVYHHDLKKYSNKKYIILNRWDDLDSEYYKMRLATILKARAAETFCIVILASKDTNECLQVGSNKNIQIVKCEDGKYGLDFKRASGPESFWKNNTNIGIRANWRSQYEMLIERLPL